MTNKGRLAAGKLVNEVLGTPSNCMLHCVLACGGVWQLRVHLGSTSARGTPDTNSTDPTNNASQQVEGELEKSEGTPKTAGQMMQETLAHNLPKRTFSPA
jgi:hypothetical protein